MFNLNSYKDSLVGNCEEREKDNDALHHMILCVGIMGMSGPLSILYNPQYISVAHHITLTLM